MGRPAHFLPADTSDYNRPDRDDPDRSAGGDHPATSLLDQYRQHGALFWLASRQGRPIAVVEARRPTRITEGTSSGVCGHQIPSRAINTNVENEHETGRDDS